MKSIIKGYKTSTNTILYYNTPLDQHKPNKIAEALYNSINNNIDHSLLNNCNSPTYSTNNSTNTFNLESIYKLKELIKSFKPEYIYLVSNAYIIDLTIKDTPESIKTLELIKQGEEQGIIKVTPYLGLDEFYKMNYDTYNQIEDVSLLFKSLPEIENLIYNSIIINNNGVSNNESN